MDKEKLTDKVSQAKDWLIDTTLHAVGEAKQRHEDDLYYKGYKNGRAKQKDCDVKAAIMAFLELKVKDHDIYKLLSEYFGIDSISKASEYLLSAKKTRQIQALKKHCLNQGMSIRDFRSYSKEHNLEERLIEDERLLEVSPEKLKSILDRD